MTIANPIYDSVFKFLMEDKRVARTILSALLKKDVVDVEMRPHEYTNSQRDTLSVFRIDFGATVRENDGAEHLILIELQKTWLETETLRFRQYLGVQYQRKENIVDDSADGHALPMVAVYLLGHKVGDIEEPVLYVRHQSFDYYDRPVTKGLPDPFVDSLTHDSIIVQIPRLHGHVGNRLAEVLSIFDQSRKNQNDQQVLTIEDSMFEGDSEMEYIIHRLLMAASDADMRMDMNVEDEYFFLIEKKDTEIVMKDREIEQKTAQLAEKSAQLAKKDDQLAEKSAQLAEKSAQLAKKDDQLAEQTAQLAAKDGIIKVAIRSLAAMGLSVAEIASQTGQDEENVRRLLKD